MRAVLFYFAVLRSVHFYAASREQLWQEVCGDGAGKKNAGSMSRAT
jgi:hypothetical protein